MLVVINFSIKEKVFFFNLYCIICIFLDIDEFVFFSLFN